jgi:hypothetical protein
MEIVVGRRSVLGGCVAGAGIAALGSTAAAQPLSAADSGVARVCAELAGPESKAFAMAFGGHSVFGIEPTMNNLLTELGAAPSGLFAGLTSDPVAMVAEQLLVAAGGHPLWRWVHRYEAGAWQHRIDFGGSDADLGALRSAGNNWPQQVARLARARLQGTVAGAEIECCSGPAPLPARSPGLLVSWAIDVRDMSAPARPANAMGVIA